MKTCRKCRETKSVELFGKSANRKDGLHSWCRECLNVQKKEKRAKERQERERPKRQLLDAGLKLCCMCKEALPLDEFSRSRNHSCGRSSRCKSCDKQYKRDHYLKNKDKINERNRRWYIENKDRAAIRSKEYYQENKATLDEYYAKYREENAEKIRRWKKQHYSKNREKILEQQKAYRIENKDSVKRRNLRYYHENREELLKKSKKYREKNKDRLNRYAINRYKTDAQANLAIKSRNYINKALSRARAGARKSDTTINLLGCSFDEFKIHIERQFTKGMTWEKVFSGEIHLDHIRPIASFDLTNPEEQADAFHYLNVRPMWAVDNMRKRDKITHLL